MRAGLRGIESLFLAGALIAGCGSEAPGLSTPEAIASSEAAVLKPGMSADNACERAILAKQAYMIRVGEGDELDRLTSDVFDTCTAVEYDAFNDKVQATSRQVELGEICTGLFSWEGTMLCASAPTPVTTPTPAPTAAPGTITVSLVRLSGLSGMRVAAFLLPGYPPAQEIQGAAGFAAVVDTDPFTATEPLRRAPVAQVWPDWPRFYDDVAQVRPGVHPLFLWASTELSPAYTYFPQQQPDLRGCAVKVRVRPGHETPVRVTDIPPYSPPDGPEGWNVMIRIESAIWPMCPME